MDLKDAHEELKRADHLLFVSLKYTRTVDVLKSIIERLITAFMAANESLLNFAKEQGKIKDIPELPLLRADAIKETFADIPDMKEFMDFYLLLRRIDKAEFDRRNEFRRHVTMTAHLEEGDTEITIDIITDYFHRTQDFVQRVESIISGEE